MKISNFNTKLTYIPALAMLFFSFIIPLDSAQAQSFDGSDTSSLVCDPLPEDTELLLSCLDILGTEQGSVGQVSEPVEGPASGTWGLAAAYNSTDDTVLFLAAGAGTGIFGEIRQAQTLAVVKSSFKIAPESGSAAARSPEAAYNPVTNQYLVIWYDERVGLNTARIFGRIINADGSFAGSDFPIHPEYNVLPDANMKVDMVNQKYVMVYGNAEFLVLRTVTFAGTVSQPLVINPYPGKWTGMPNVAYNSNLNEYWVVYIYVASGNDTAEEDNRIEWIRVDAATMQIIGEPVQLNQTRIGRSAFSMPGIDYSPTDGAAMVGWLERGRDGTAASVYGRMIYDNLTLSSEFPILTPQTYSGSDAYWGARMLKYNSFTGTFVVAGEDNNSGVTYAEMLAGGTIVDVGECLSPSGARGLFWPGITPYRYGTLCMASRDFESSVLSQVESYMRNRAEVAIPPVTPRTPDNLSATGLAQAISRIYIWSLGLAGLLAVAVSVWGGYLVMTARGNAQQASKGKSYITSSLLGMVLLMAAYVILSTLNSDLAVFDVPDLNILN